MKMSAASTSGDHSEFGYAIDLSTNGDCLIVSSKKERRLFTSDWDYVTMMDTHIFIYERNELTNELALLQTILLHSENEGIDAPVSLSAFGHEFIVGLPWLTYGSFQGHAYIYTRDEESNMYVQTSDLMSPSGETDGGDNAFGAAVAMMADYSFVGKKPSISTYIL